MRTSLGEPPNRQTATPPQVGGVQDDARLGAAATPEVPTGATGPDRTAVGDPTHLEQSADITAESELDGPMEHPEVPDELVDDLSTADGFSRWVRPHWPAMARLAARYSRDADDILQDALVVAWRKRVQFDPARGTARTWLLAITADQRSKAWRRTVRTLSRPWADPETGRTLSESVRDLTFDAASPELRLDLRRAISRLPAKQALAVDLHYYLGLGIADVATVMRCPEGTVKSHLSRARDRLRTQLGDDYR